MSCFPYDKSYLWALKLIAVKGFAEFVHENFGLYPPTGVVRYVGKQKNSAQFQLVVFL